MVDDFDEDDEAVEWEDEGAQAEAGEAEREEGEELLVEEDLPCVGCGYNLRGLKEDGKCPECGLAIGESVEIAMERVLCLACMRPNHPALQRCGHCGAPLSGAAATAGYWEATPSNVQRANMPAGRGAARRPSLTLALLISLVGIGGFMGLLATAVAGDGGGSPLVFFLCGLMSLVALAAAFFAIKNYQSRYREYLMEMEKMRAAGSERSSIVPQDRAD
jgi:hypothetical protein